MSLGRDFVESETVKPREQRKKAILRATVCVNGSWTDACIIDVSARGLGLQTSRPPPRGTYVEIRNGSLLIVGRIVWANGQRFGVRTQDPLDVDAIARSAGEATKAPSPAPAKSQPLDRAKNTRTHTDQNGEKSRFLGRSMQFLSLAAAAVAAALFVVSAVEQALVKPLADILSGIGAS